MKQLVGSVLAINGVRQCSTSVFGSLQQPERIFFPARSYLSLNHGTCSVLSAPLTQATGAQYSAIYAGFLMIFVWKFSVMWLTRGLFFCIAG